MCLNGIIREPIHFFRTIDGTPSGPGDVEDFNFLAADIISDSLKVLMFTWKIFLGTLGNADVRKLVELLSSNALKNGSQKDYSFFPALSQFHFQDTYYKEGPFLCVYF